MKKKEFLFSVDIYYEDTDCGGIVYHTSYLRFAERARSSMILNIYPRIKENLKNKDNLFVVRGLVVSYIKPCKLFDNLIIKTLIVKVTRTSVYLQQNIIKSNLIHCKIDVELVWVRAKSGKPSRIPDDLKFLLNEKLMVA